ncbi:unnamed protein product, partial [Dicrocoelium dendriticum]
MLAIHPQRPRPRVPRMGTSLPVVQHVTASRTTSTTAHALPPDGNIHERGIHPVDTEKQDGQTATNDNREDNRVHKDRRHVTLQLLLASARTGSSSMSRDIRKLFNRYSLTKYSLTPISERTKESTNSTGHLTGRSRSNSTSECSEDTETTTLSFTWPLSRSQTDISSKIYRPTPRQTLLNEQETGATREPFNLANKELTSSVETNPTLSNATSVANEQEAGKHTQEWINMLHSEETLQRLESMRIITLTAKKWKIKRRPNGTRYLSYKKPTQSKHKSHLHCKSTGHEPDSTRNETPDIQTSIPAHNPCFLNSTALQATSSDQLRMRKTRACQPPHASPKPPTSCSAVCGRSVDRAADPAGTISAVRSPNNLYSSTTGFCHKRSNTKPTSPPKTENNFGVAPCCAQRRNLLPNHISHFDCDRVMRSSSQSDRRRHSNFVQTCPLAHKLSCRICFESAGTNSAEPCRDPACISGGVSRRSTNGATKLVTMLV